ncbi:hypothetical protein ACIBG4_40485 [Nonomuraea sp. NPDC050383]|uniref:hypothetical protein n=1 Tax=Nonomuraea sp. NPDC050383 TaxID=3364362 RepID=UPI00379695F5
MTPQTLCILAIAAAAIVIGRHTPASRARRERNRAERVAAARRRTERLGMVGHLAVHDNEALFLRFLADHPELRSIRKGA